MKKFAAHASDLKEIIRLTGFTPAEVAKKTGINPKTLANALAGSQKLDDYKLYQIRSIGLQPGEPASPITSNCKDPIRVRYVHVVSWAQAGQATEFEDLPVDWMKRVPTDVDDGRAFGVELKGNSMEPKFWEGQIAILMPSKQARSGDLVVANIKNRGPVFKMFHHIKDKVRLTSFNPAYPAHDYIPTEFHWIYPVHGVFTPTYNV